MGQPSHTICPRCGAADIRVDGLCARCLGALNVAADSELTGESAVRAPVLAPDDLAPHFPQLEILECLGRGGMGVVYKARQKSLNRLVALKLLAPERADDPQFAQRFEREAQALAALNHPHIVGVYDFGQAGGYFYLLMEFVDGVNLRQLLEARRLTPGEALSIVPPVCEALQCAHDHGIVHRDIKPENLLLDKAGSVKIADFGIAKIVNSPANLGQQPAGGSATDPVATRALGTPDYAAPEQVHGAADHRADIYSLGVVLYEMLTGERPKDKIEAPSKRIKLDIRIDEIVLRALEKQPELRFQTAAEFRAQVEKSNRNVSQHSRSERKWQLVAGLTPFFAGLILLLGASTLNELVDDFGLTQNARKQLQLRRQAIEAAAQARAEATAAVTRMEAAKSKQDDVESERLSREAKAAHVRSMQAEAELNRVAGLKEADEQRRIATFRFVAGALIAGGLAVLFIALSGRKEVPTVPNDRLTKAGTATLVTPRELDSAWAQFFCYRTKGQLVLDETSLTHSYAGGTTIIPLKAVRDVSIGRLPRSMNPSGLDVLSIAYEKAGQLRQVLVSPVQGYLGLSRQDVSEWFTAIRAAVVAATGKTPAMTPAEHLGLPRSAKPLVFLLVALPAALVTGWIGLVVLQEAPTATLAQQESQQQASKAAMAFTVTQAEVPQGSHQLVVRLRREGTSASNLRIETSLHVVAGTSSEKEKRMPKNGAWNAARVNLVQPADTLTLTWTLPEEVSETALHEAAARIMERFANSPKGTAIPFSLNLLEGEPIRLAEISHPHGWECHLYLMAVKPESVGVSATQETDTSDPNDPQSPAAEWSDVTTTYSLDFAFEGAGKEARLRDDVRTRIEQFVQKVDEQTGRTPDIALHPDARRIIVKAPPGQQRMLAELLADLKQRVAKKFSDPNNL